MTKPSGCQARREALMVDVLGGLDAAEAAELHVHLKTCAACRALRAAFAAEEQDLMAAFALVAERSERASLIAPAVSLSGGSEAQETGTWARRVRRAIMRHKWVIPAAAAAAVLIIIGVWPGTHDVGRAYGMADVPELLRSSIIHVRGETYVPPVAPPGQERTKIDCEYWVDAVRGCARQTFYTYDASPGKTTISLGERVVDGEYVMTLDHTARTASFTRLNELHRALEARRTLTYLCDMFAPGRAGPDAFVPVGSEQIDGTEYRVWQYTMEDSRIGMAYKAECAVAPATGDIGAVRAWIKGSGNPEWSLMVRLGQWDRGVTPPPGTFDTAVPDGYTAETPKEAAQVEPLAYEGGSTGNGIATRKHIGFRLADGGVILAWSSQDQENESSQAGLFADLTFGGPLPKLPLEITGLKQRVAGREVSYVGRHLAYTRQGDEFIEWSLYVPQQEPPSRWQTYYEVEHRFNVAPGRATPIIVENVSQPFWVDNAADFDLIVRGAMAELSDDHQAPPEVTYARVLELGAR